MASRVLQEKIRQTASNTSSPAMPMSLALLRTRRLGAAGSWPVGFVAIRFIGLSIPHRTPDHRELIFSYAPFDLSLDRKNSPTAATGFFGRQSHRRTLVLYRTQDSPNSRASCLSSRRIITSTTRILTTVRAIPLGEPRNNTAPRKINTFPPR